MANSNVITLTVEFIKNSSKSTLSFSESATTNLTGRIVDINNYKLRGQDLAEYVVGSKATVCISDEGLSQYLLNEVEDEFLRRNLEGDQNPVIAISFRAIKINQTNTGYLVYGVSSATIVPDYQAEQAISLEQFKQQAESIKIATQVASEAALTRNKPKLRASSMAASLMVQDSAVTAPF